MSEKDAASHGVAGLEPGLGLITHLSLKHHEAAAAPGQRLSSEGNGFESFGEIRGQLGIVRNGIDRENYNCSLFVFSRKYDRLRVADTPLPIIADQCVLAILTRKITCWILVLAQCSCRCRRRQNGERDN